MFEQLEQDVPPVVMPPPTAEQEVPAAEGASPDVGRWHAEAGRKGARRVHQLIEEGKLYEKEHGLKRGRQRLRQLLELGKLYEQEHGLRPARVEGRLPRMSRQLALRTLLHSLAQLVKPSLRPQVQRMLEVLDEPPTEQRQAG